MRKRANDDNAKPCSHALKPDLLSEARKFVKVCFPSDQIKLVLLLLLLLLVMPAFLFFSTLTFKAS